MGQKNKGFREFWTPFLLRVIYKTPRSTVRACVEGDDPICSKNRKIVPYHGANPNTRNGARLRSPSPIMAPDTTLYSPISSNLRIQTYLLSPAVTWFRRKEPSEHLNKPLGKSNQLFIHTIIL